MGWLLAPALELPSFLSGLVIVGPSRNHRTYLRPSRAASREIRKQSGLRLRQIFLRSLTGWFAIWSLMIDRMPNRRVKKMRVPCIKDFGSPITCPLSLLHHFLDAHCDTQLACFPASPNFLSLVGCLTSHLRISTTSPPKPLQTHVICHPTSSHVSSGSDCATAIGDNNISRR